MSDSDNTTAWVTVAEAAERADVDSGTVRQWYRSGRIPTRRSEGERGAFLVPLDLVLSLVQPAPQVPSAAAPSIEEFGGGLAAEQSAELESVKGELASSRSELEATREQLEFLRRQLAELSEENRTTKQHLQESEDQSARVRAQVADAVDERRALQARLAGVEDELAQLRKVAARSSITDNSWLEEATPAYESPVRRQAMASASPEPAAPFASSPPEPGPGPGTGPTAPYTPTPESIASDLADLLAATRPDDEEDDPPDVKAAPADNGRWADDDEGGRDPDAIWTDDAPHPALGHHDDDLFPESDKKGRFGKR